MRKEAADVNGSEPTPPDARAPAYRIRSISGADATGLMAFHDALSSETIRLRFLGAHQRLSDTEAERFTRVDDEIIGVGRYERLAARAEAEVAFVVADAWQGQGVGTTLFREIAHRARAVGVLRLRAETLVDNRRMLEVFKRSGYAMSTSHADGVVSVTMTMSSATTSPWSSP
jgi:GNAT superfamily N-acetyltransferase